MRTLPPYACTPKVPGRREPMSSLPCIMQLDPVSAMSTAVTALEMVDSEMLTDAPVRMTMPVLQLRRVHVLAATADPREWATSAGLQSMKLQLQSVMDAPLTV